MHANGVILLLSNIRIFFSSYWPIMDILLCMLIPLLYTLYIFFLMEFIIFQRLLEYVLQENTISVILLQNFNINSVCYLLFLCNYL